MTPYPKALEAFPRLRQSTLSTFDECPLTFSFEHEYGKGFSHAPAARGVLWHRFQHKALNEMAAQHEEKIEVDVALAILHEVLRQADIPDEDVVACPMYEIQDLYWMVKKFAYETTWSIRELYDVEQRLEALVSYPDPEGGHVDRVVTGQLDALFINNAGDRATVVDAKTGWWLPPPSEVSEAGFFQQRFYALLVFENIPTVGAVTLREFYPRFCESREATIYRDKLDDLRYEFAALAERFDRAFETRSWNPAPGKQCSYCIRPEACPIFPRARKLGSIETPANAAYVAERVLVAEAYIKQGKEALKAWTAENGPVPIRDAKQPREFGYTEQRRIARPTREQTQNAMQMGVNPTTLYKENKGTRFSAHPVKSQPTEPEDEAALESLAALADRINERIAS